MSMIVIPIFIGMISAAFSSDKIRTRSIKMREADERKAIRRQQGCATR